LTLMHLSNTQLIYFTSNSQMSIITLMFRAHSTSLTPPHYIEVPIPSQENDESSIFMLDVNSHIIKNNEKHTFM
jgi:hypothetical protein